MDRYAPRRFEQLLRQMLAEPLELTPYADINNLLSELLAQVQAICGSHLIGVYLSGSLALGDFDIHSSDIDLVVVTDITLSGELFAALRDMHARLAGSGALWASKLEAVYVPEQTLRHDAPASAVYPVLEKGSSLVMDHLEDAWSVQCHTLREHGLALAGPKPRVLVAPVDPNRMRREGCAIAEMWLAQARSDPSWLDWLRLRENQVFVILTLCRLLYTLETGDVASKPGATRWALQAQFPRWTGLIERALSGRQNSAEVSSSEEGETVALIQYTVDQFRLWEGGA